MGLPVRPQGRDLADILLDTPARFYPVRLAGKENSSVRVSRRAVPRTQDYLSGWYDSHHTPDPRAHPPPPSEKTFGVKALYGGPPNLVMGRN